MIAPIYIFGVTKMDGMLSHIEELLEAKNIFVRNRKQRRTRALGILMYHYGISLRKRKTILSSFKDIFHESIRKWYHKTDTIFSVGKCYRETVAVDETKRKINGRLYILRAATEYTKLGNTWCLGNQIFILKHRIKLFYRNKSHNTTVDSIQSVDSLF
jgi:hypothetical protein